MEIKNTKEELAKNLISAQAEDNFDRARRILDSQEILSKNASKIDELLVYLRDSHPGKEKCDTLRNIRKKIAEVNGIDYEPGECTHVGPCLGTCPMCDAELAYLDKELDAKRERGEEISISGIAKDDVKKSGCDISAPIFDSDLEDGGFDSDNLMMGAPDFEEISELSSDDIANILSDYIPLPDYSTD